MAQELGLHREQLCLDTDPESHAEQGLSRSVFEHRSQPNAIDLEESERSARVLFWCVLVHDTFLVSKSFHQVAVDPWSLPIVADTKITVQRDW